MDDMIDKIFPYVLIGWGGIFLIWVYVFIRWSIAAEKYARARLRSANK